MTLRAYLITMRGRLREALCPELQVLRYENELLRRALSAQRRALSLAVEQTTADARSLASKWESLFNAQVQLTEAARHRAEKAEAERNEALKKTERREQNWSLIHSALEAAGIHLRSRDDDWLQEIIIQCAKERNEARAELSACADERNNYSRILTVLGMEDEGDPVAEVDALMQERDQLHEARAEWARLTTLRPASEHDGGAEVLWWGDGEFRYIGNEGDDWLCWTPLPDVKEPK